MIRFTVNLQQEERDALRELAERERRDMRDQAALLIRQQLETFGYLPTPQPQPATQKNTMPQAVQNAGR